MTKRQREAVETLFGMVYGNGGPCHSRGNHHYLRCQLDSEPDKAMRYQPTQECIDAFNRCMEGDYRDLPASFRRRMDDENKCNEELSAWMSRDKNKNKGQESPERQGENE